MRLSPAVRVFVGIVAVALGVSCSDGSKAPSTNPPSSGRGGVVPGAGDSWSVYNGLIRLTVSIDKTAGLVVNELRNLQTGRDWNLLAQPDTIVTLNGAAVALGTTDGFQFKNADISEDGSGRELRLTFEHAPSRIRATRHYVCYDGAPVIETFTVFEGAGGTATVANINSWRLAVSRGELEWVDGGIPQEEGSSFTLRRRTLSAGQRLDLGAEGRSTERHVPWVSVMSGGEYFFGGVMWSGAWSIAVAAGADRQDITAGLAPMSTTVGNGASVEGPHGFVGVATEGEDSVSRAMVAFFGLGVRLGKPLQPLVTYNTWFATGAAIDEESTRNEIDHAAALGADLYVMDAGWWIGAAAMDRFDFTSGLGRWTADPERFPSGLRAMRDYAHSQGLKFGIWMEPERFALELLGEPGLVDEAWLAKRDGRYDPKTTPSNTTSAQICLAHAEAKAWVLDQVLTLIDAVQPDYLKWDNNFWVNCNRGGHGHGTSDGNFAHVRALYEILQTIRESYPDLLIENCSGGGHRLDYGLARYTDVAWMDDRTGPSVHVRHNLEGLSAVFPAAYLFSFVIPEAEEGSGIAEDVRLLYRSRMPGVLGIGTGMSPEQELISVQEIRFYRQLREIQRDAVTALLTPQAGSGATEGWDALQQTSPSGDVVLFAYQTDPGVESIVVSPKWLNPDAIYSAASLDGGPIGQAGGADLMEQGVEIVASPLTTAHILVLRLVSPPSAARRRTR